MWSGKQVGYDQSHALRARKAGALSEAAGIVRTMNEAAMGVTAVVAVVDRLDCDRIAVWVDGAWGIDALVGHQTRYHADLDLVIATADLPRAQGDGLSGAGTIAGRPVRCLTPQLQLRHHLGYPLDQDDRHDLRQLNQCFGLELPPGM